MPPPLLTCALPGCEIEFPPSSARKFNPRRFCCPYHAKILRLGVPCTAGCGGLVLIRGTHGYPDADPARARCQACRRTAAAAARKEATAAREAARPRCEVCGAVYRRSYGAQRTCGRACGWQLKIREGKTHIHYPRSPVAYGRCEICGRAWAEPGTQPLRACEEHQAEWNRREHAARYERQKATARAKYAAWRAAHPLPVPPEHPCEWCGEATTRKRHCSERCADRSYAAERDEQHGRFKPSPVKRQRIYARDGGTCHWCWLPVRTDLAKGPWAASLDHLVAQAAGGSHHDGNLVTAHLWCNVMRVREPWQIMPGKRPPRSWPAGRRARAAPVQLSLIGP